MDLTALADFNLVAMHGGFGRAGRATGRPKATLSRRVAELEASLGVRLIERGSRSLRLTEAGEALQARTGPLLAEIAEAGEAISAGIAVPRGRLRVSAPIVLAHTILGRLAAGFVRDYPEVKLEIVAEDRFVDPVEDRYDIVIRVDPRPDDGLVGRCILRDDKLLVAVPGMVPPDELRTGAGLPLRAVVRAALPPGATWSIRDGERRFDVLPEPVLCLSTFLVVRDAVLAGGGAALLPRSMVGEDVGAGRLRCWGVAEERPAEIWALHTSRRLVSAKVMAFMACLEGLRESFPASVGE